MQWYVKDDDLTFLKVELVQCGLSAVTLKPRGYDRLGELKRPVRVSRGHPAMPYVRTTFIVGFPRGQIVSEMIKYYLLRS